MDLQKCDENQLIGRFTLQFPPTNNTGFTIPKDSPPQIGGIFFLACQPRKLKNSSGFHPFFRRDIRDTSSVVEITTKNISY